MELKTDREFKIYNEGVKSNHPASSKQTLDLFKSMNDKFDNLKDKVTSFETNIVKGMGEMELRIVKEIGKIKDDITDSCDKKYAKKWVADAMKIVMTTIAVAIIGAGLALILK